MHLKTHFKVLFNSSKISKTCAHIIFLLNTRHYQELNKIGTITFGSTKLDLHIFESCTQICEKQNKQNKKENLTSYWASPNRSGGPRLARVHSPETAQPRSGSLSATATDNRDPRVSDRKTEHGEE